jgi:hypothetical protein
MDSTSWSSIRFRTRSTKRLRTPSRRSQFMVLLRAIRNNQGRTRAGVGCVRSYASSAAAKASAAQSSAAAGSSSWARQKR